MRRTQSIDGTAVVASSSRYISLATLLALTALLSFFSTIASASASAVSKSEVEGYQHNFDVSAETAERNLTIQQLGVGITGQLKTIEGNQYAGVWFNNETGKFVIPLASSATRAAVDALAGADNLEGDFRIEPVNYSWRELEAAQSEVRAALLPNIEQGLIQLSINTGDNAVVIAQAEAITQADETDIQHQVENEGSKVEVRAETVKHFHVVAEACNYTYRICDQPMRGGVDIEPAGKESVSYPGDCTAAFKAKGIEFGNRFMLTAGHCIHEPEGSTTEEWASFTSGSEYKPLGAVGKAWDYPEHDYAAIKANKTYWDTTEWPSEVANWGVSQEYPIENEAWSYEGEYVCHIGDATGKSCGEVKELNAEIMNEFENGSHEIHDYPVYHAVKFGTVSEPICSYPGDSGGPVFHEHTALGIYSSSNGSAKESEGEKKEHECQRVGFYTEVTEDDTLLAVTVGPRLGGAPTSETEVAANIHGRRATAYGTIDPDGLPTTYRFEYGLTTGYGSSAPAGEGEAGHGISYTRVNATMAGLQLLTTYHYRLVATNASGTAYGTDKQFTTTAEPPNVTTEAASGIAAGAATLHGTVDPEDADTHYYFEWGTGIEYGNKVPVSPEDVGSGMSNVAVSNAIGGLRGETTYHFRLVAYNSEGTTYGLDQQFTTPNWRPSVTSEGATEVSLRTYKLSGKINPEGFGTHYRFEWGTTESYGTKYESPTELTGSSESAVSHEIVSLGSDTLYYFRIVAENSEGKSEAKGDFATPRYRYSATWATQASENPKEAKASKLAGVTCTSSTECTAVGEYKNGAGIYQSLAERWKGSAWEIQATPEHSTNTSMTGASCSTSSSCEAVGYDLNTSGSDVTLAEHWNGTKWEAQTIPDPGMGGLLTGVSCTSSTECTAVGYYKSGATETKTLADRWNGKEWTTQTTPNGSGASLTELTGVSCNTFIVLGSEKKECIASGYEKNIFGVYEALAERWNGTEWSIKSVPLPEEKAKASYLLGISCASSTECEAVGYYENSSSVNVALADHWSGYYGTTWTVQAAANPSGAKLTELSGDSCITEDGALECEAVGEYENSSSVSGPLAEQWFSGPGSGWELQSTPSIGGAKAGFLRGVKCSAGAKPECKATGYYENSSGVEVTLAENSH